MKVEELLLSIGLHLTGKKTNVLSYNHLASSVKLKTKDDTELEVDSDFTYLGSCNASILGDITNRKASAWQACHKLSNIWKFNLPKAFKLCLLSVVAASILLYGSETWTIAEILEKQLDGCYTRMLRMVTNTHWTK